MIGNLTYGKRARAIAKAKQLAKEFGETHFVYKSLGEYSVYGEREICFGTLVYSTDEGDIVF